MKSESCTDELLAFEGKRNRGQRVLGNNTRGSKQWKHKDCHTGLSDDIH